MTERRRVAIVDDHDMLRDALGAALAADGRLEVVLNVGSVGQFDDSAAEVDFDVVLADLALTDGSGKDVADIAESRYGRPVLLMTGQGDREGVQAAIDCGCAGFISKSASVDELVAAIEIIADGGAVFPAQQLRSVLTQPGTSARGITDRELDVLTLLARGLTAGEIAAEMSLSVHTARNHIRALLSKLHARSQLEAVVTAVREGLVTIDATSGGG